MILYLLERLWCVIVVLYLLYFLILRFCSIKLSVDILVMIVCLLFTVFCIFWVVVWSFMILILADFIRNTLAFMISFGLLFILKISVIHILVCLI